MRVGSLKLALGRTYAARCAASGDQAPASTCSLVARGFGGCPRASSLQFQSRGTYRRFPFRFPQTGAVSEAVPSTVFHQRLDPADNCSVLYPVGDNQGRRNFTKPVGMNIPVDPLRVYGKAGRGGLHWAPRSPRRRRLGDTEGRAPSEVCSAGLPYAQSTMRETKLASEKLASLRGVRGVSNQRASTASQLPSFALLDRSTGILQQGSQMGCRIVLLQGRGQRGGGERRGGLAAAVSVSAPRGGVHYHVSTRGPRFWSGIGEEQWTRRPWASLRPRGRGREIIRAYFNPFHSVFTYRTRALFYGAR